MHVIFSMLISFHLPLPILFSASAHFSPSIYLLNILISFSYAKVHKYSPSLFFWFSLLSLSLSSLNEQKVAAEVFSSHLWQLMLLLPLGRRANCDSISDFDFDSDSDLFLRIQRRAYSSRAELAIHLPFEFPWPVNMSNKNQISNE